MTHDCIQCDFHGRAPGHLKKHLETKKHINIILIIIKRKERKSVSLK